MPLVHIDLLEGRSAEYHAAVLAGVRSALMASIGVPSERIIQRIHTLAPDRLDLPAGKTDRALVIEVTMLEGRSAELKGGFYDDVRRRLAEDPGIAPEDVFVIVRDAVAGDLCLGTGL